MKKLTLSALLIGLVGIGTLYAEIDPKKSEDAKLTESEKALYSDILQYYENTFEGNMNEAISDQTEQVLVYDLAGNLVDAQSVHNGRFAEGNVPTNASLLMEVDNTKIYIQQKPVSISLDLLRL